MAKDITAEPKGFLSVTFDAIRFSNTSCLQHDEVEHNPKVARGVYPTVAAR